MSLSQVALQKELIRVKQQLAEAQLIQDKSDTANKYAEDAQAKLLEQMEKNYAVAQRVQAEKAKRQESDHYIKGLRDQMREATTRAMKVASELDREKSKNQNLRNQIVRAQKNAMERLDNYEEEEERYEDDSDEHQMDNLEDHNINTENTDPQLQGTDASNSTSLSPSTATATATATAATFIVTTTTTTNSTTKPRRKRRLKRGKKKRRKQVMSAIVGDGTSTSAAVVPRLSRRPSTSSQARSSTEKLRLAKSHSTDLFHRLADAKRSVKAARAESDAKSKQLHALSNHLEKMMSLLRAEAAAKASAEEALRSTEDELDVVRQEKLMLAAQVGSLKMNEKDEMSRDHMLTKQLELMDEKYSTLMRTNNFNRAREEREAKQLRKKMHNTTENMHTMMRRCEDAEVANRNTVHALSSLVASLSKMDRTPFRLEIPGLIPMTNSDMSRSTLKNELVVLELQDCSLGDHGALAVVDALNAFVTQEAERHSAVLDLKKRTKGAVKMSDDGKSNVGSTVNDLDLIQRRRPPVRMSVNLSFNNITEANECAVIKSLCRSIVATHCITELDLRGNCIGGDGMKMILDALQYNDGVRAVDLSGNYIEDADLLVYINSSKHVVGLPPLLMLADGGAKERERVQVHDDKMELDKISRLRRHGMNVGNGSRSNGCGGRDSSSSGGGSGSGRRQRGRQRPASAPTTGRRKIDNSLRGRKDSRDKERNKPQVIIDFPPKTSAVNAVQRVILDSITRNKAQNPYRRTENVEQRGRQSLSGSEAPPSGSGSNFSAATATASAAATTVSKAKNQGGNNRGRGVDPTKHSGSTPRGLYLQTMTPRSARSQSSDRASKEAASAVDGGSSTTSIRSRLRLPPKRAASASLLRTPAGMAPRDRRAKYAAEEQKMLERRKEAEMLREATRQSGSRSTSRNVSRSASRVLEENGEDSEEEFRTEEQIEKEREEQKRQEEEEAAMYPKYGGQYAHEIFWPAFALARSGNYSGVVEWLDKGMYGDVREPETGQSLLMAAAISNSDILIRMLLRKGGKVNGRCNKGWTPLHHCIASGTPYLYIADQLISRGAKTEMRDNIGVTALQLAVEQGSADAICRLIEAGADIRTKDDEGRTVLHRCAARKLFRCCFDVASVDYVSRVFVLCC